MTMETIQELEAAHLDLVSQVKELRKLLLGDEELRAKWEAGKPNYPNIAEPHPGALASLNSALDGHDRVISRLLKASEEVVGRIETRLAFVTRLEAFFGPMLRDKNPPMDGAEIATRAYVDEGFARLSRALREEFTNMGERAREVCTSVLRQVGAWDGKASSVGLSANIVSDRLRWVYQRELQREQAEIDRSTRPSRLQLLVQLVTGRTPRKAAAT